MVLDGDGVRRRVDRPPGLLQRGVSADVFDVGQDGAQHQQAVGAADELLQFLAPDEAAIDAQIEGMVLADG